MIPNGEGSWGKADPGSGSAFSMYLQITKPYTVFNGSSNSGWFLLLLLFQRLKKKRKHKDDGSMFKSPSLFLSNSSSLKMVLQGQHWEAVVPDAGALRTITACCRCTRSNKKHCCAVAARLEVYLSAHKEKGSNFWGINSVVVASCQW